MKNQETNTMTNQNIPYSLAQLLRAANLTDGMASNEYLLNHSVNKEGYIVLEHLDPTRKKKLTTTIIPDGSEDLLFLEMEIISQELVK